MKEYEKKVFIVLLVQVVLIYGSDSSQLNFTNRSEIQLNSNTHQRKSQILTCCKLKPPKAYKEETWTDDCKSKSLDSSTNNFDIVEDVVWKVNPNLMSTNTSWEFNLREKKPICTKGSFMVNISSDSIDSEDNYYFYPNGYLKVRREFYAPDSYCIHSFQEEIIEVKICIPDCSIRACIPKCCSYDKVYSVGINSSTRGCQPPQRKSSTSSTENYIYFNPPLFHDFYTQLSEEEIRHEPLPHYFHWKTTIFKYNCPKNKTSIFPSSASLAHNMSTFLNLQLHSMDFRIRKDGALLYRNEVEKKCGIAINDQRMMCFEGVQDFGSLQDFTNSQEEIILFICSLFDVENLEQHASNRTYELIYGVLMVVISIFPFLTSLVYLLLWSRQNVHGWTIASTTGSLFFMYIFQGSALIIGSSHDRKRTETLDCTIIAVISHFFFLATFSWLTVMCCDLYWTFRALTPTNRRSKGSKKFIKYSMFGWGFPTAFVTTGIIIDYMSDDCTSYTVPGYGTQSCWIIPTSQGVYAFYPVAILLSLNIVFFTVTCVKLLKYRKNTKFATKRETNNWQSFSRFTKLLLVMGIMWITDIISWIIDGLNLRWYWILLDIINIIRAVGVFIVYVCKQDILQLLEDTYPRLKRLFGPFKRKCSEDLSEQTGSTAMSPLSQQFQSFRISR